jgi:hypothetical protein
MDPHDQLDEWVNRRLAVLQLPQGWPDEDVARTRLDQRLAQRPRRVVLWISAAAAVCAALLVLPQTRAVGQRLWDQVFVGRLQIVITNDDGAAASFFSPELQQRPEPRPVQSLEDASRLAGYTPRLPRLDAFASVPRYSVTDGVSGTLRLDTRGIRGLLARVGGASSEVPEAWNGAVLEVRVGPVVLADYGSTLLLQSRPFQLMTPPDFDLEAFYRIAFRSFGMSERDARTLSADLGISPAWLTFMPREDDALVHEFQTRSGTVLLIEEVYGHDKTLAVWSTPNRLYALFGATAALSRSFVTEVSDALD